jgi:hypothetical protein
MISNTSERTFDVVEITNEMPRNRIGGVGTVIENLISGFEATGTRVLWFLVDHRYRRFEVDEILARYPSVAVGTHDDVHRFHAPVAHLHSYNVNARLVGALAGRTTVFTVHSLLVEEARSNDVDLSGAVRLLAACDLVVVVSDAELARYRAIGYDALNPRVAVVHNGVRAPDRYRTPRGKVTLGFSGRLVPRKHPEYVQMEFRAAIERWLDADEASLATLAAGARARHRECFTDVAMATCIPRPLRGRDALTRAPRRGATFPPLRWTSHVSRDPSTVAGSGAPDQETVHRTHGAVLAGPRARHTVIDTEEERCLVKVKLRVRRRSAPLHGSTKRFSRVRRLQRVLRTVE